MQLHQLIRNTLTDTRELDQVKLAEKVFASINPEERDEALFQALVSLCSAAMTAYSRSPAHQETATAAPVRRHRQQFTGRRESLIEGLLHRPFFVPSLGTRVYYKDMTASHWREYTQDKQVRAQSYQRSAEWGQAQLALLEEHKVERSGDLPEAVIKEQFTREDIQS